MIRGMEPLINFRISPDLLLAIEEWRRRQPVIPGKSEAMRELIKRGLGLSDGTPNAK